MQIHTALLNFAGLGVHEEYSLEHADMLATLLEDVQVVYTALSSQMGVAVVPTQTELLRRMFYFYRELLVSVEDEGSTLEGCMTFVQQRILQVATSLMPPPRHPHAFQTLQGLLFMYLTTVMLMRKRPYDGGDGHWMVYLPNGPVFEQIKLQVSVAKMNLVLGRFV